MSSTPLPLPLTDIIEVSVSAAAPAIGAKTFNQGLIVGSSAVIPSYGSNPRLRLYPSLAAILAGGFNSSEPEYLAAEIYFEQESGPQYLWIGRQDLSSIQTLVPHSGAAGANYKAGDIVGVVQGSASNGFAQVLTINSSGAVLTLGKIPGQQGTGYSVATDLGTTGGSGTGLYVDITSVGDTLLDAVQACALINQNWYGFMCCGAADADHLALAAWSSANWQTAMYFGASTDAAIASGTANNIAIQLQNLTERAFLMYSTTQGGLYPNNIYAAAGPLGEFCGLNTGLAGSAFTLNLKQIVGVAPEPITQTQFTTITDQNCNVVVTFGPWIGYLYDGTLSSGEYFDQILNRAMLVNQIQTNLMNLLIAVPKVPQTNPGEDQLIGQVNAACANMASIGYLAQGTWNGATITFANGTVFISAGQAVALGYLNGAAPYSTQSAGARAARQAMPIYCCILEAGAVHSVQISVSVQL
jgi:hypothetical protein